jgi:hypothetical protein
MSKFPKGIYAKSAHENAPDFVKAKVSIKIKEAIEWLKEQTGDYVNLDLKKSKDGKLYLEIDEWKPKAKAESQPEPIRKQGEIDNDPF